MALNRTDLTRDRVLAAAADLIDRNGLNDLSMRALARELDVGVMTLYSYVRTKDELLDAVADTIIGGLDLSYDESQPWDRQLVTIFTKLLDSLDRQPAARELFLMRSVEGPAIDMVRDDVIRILRAAGYSPEQSLHALAMLYSFTLGYAASRHRTHANSHAFGEINVRQSPHLAEALLAYPGRASIDSYATGLQFLIDGIAQGL